MTSWAHSVNEAGVRHDLAAHLTTVADLAAGFAVPFGGAELARWAGLWHDLGKFHPDFQAYLLDAEAGKRRRGPDHKGAGASVAMQACQPLALLVQGHHGGLPSRADVPGWLRERLADPRTAEALIVARVAGAMVEPGAPVSLPKGLARHDNELFLRLLFSALVDADYLDTEQHFHGERTEVRGGTPGLEQLWSRLETYQARTSGMGSGIVNEIRHQVYQACLAAADQAPGFFRLTVPTGGGKTRSGLGFALRHALRHGLRRVIVALPYTSITDQTAKTYRDILGDDRAVLEHHSALRHPDTPDDAPTPDWSRLATENWDAPLIVTTTVQLFDSLFAASPTACRKLHNIAGSVIILDEVQTLPAGLLTPILDLLRGLVELAGVSVVLCTATQPALEPATGFPGLPGIRDIIDDPTPLFDTLRRVRYTLPRAGERLTWEEIAALARDEPQSLTVLNTRRDALALMDALDDPEALHLSTLLCGAHRQGVLATVRERLRTGAPCRLVSTQVVEAGVDLDFPLVLRALGPLDRIIQAAGRCNREGRLAGGGRVIVFDPVEGGLPRGEYRTATDTTAIFLRQSGVDLDAPDVARAYFRRLYQNVDRDRERLQDLRAALDYPEVARRGRLIKDDTRPVVVPYAPAGTIIGSLLQELRDRPARARSLVRRLQPFTVALTGYALNDAVAKDIATEIIPDLGLWQWHGGYDPTRGIVAGAADPGPLVW